MSKLSTPFPSVSAYLTLMLGMRPHIVLLLVVFSQLLGDKLVAQNTYRSKEGSLSVTTDYVGAVITAHSKSVEVSLDYETSAFALTLASGDIHTGIDSLNRKFQELAMIFVLKGNLNLGRIPTSTHLPERLAVTGVLEVGQNQKVEIKGSGRLEHVSGGEDLACELALYFDVDARRVGLHQLVNGQEESHLIKVQFFETVLRKTY